MNHLYRQNRSLNSVNPIPTRFGLGILNLVDLSPDIQRTQLPMCHRYRAELYPDIPGLGFGCGIRDKDRNELRFPLASRQSRRDGNLCGIAKINVAHHHRPTRIPHTECDSTSAVYLAALFIDEIEMHPNDATGVELKEADRCALTILDVVDQYPHWREQIIHHFGAMLSRERQSTSPSPGK